MYTNQLNALAEMSNKYGADPRFVLAGGGNTSFKSKENLWIKGSGTALATIKAEDFVVMDRSKLNMMWSANYPENEAARESAVLQDMMDARVEGETRRPSVETLLHNLFPQRYILHVHPTTVNGITADGATENAYWAFYIGEEYAQTGVDATEIVAGTTYTFAKTISE